MLHQSLRDRFILMRLVAVRRTFYTTSLVSAGVSLNDSTAYKTLTFRAR